MSRLLIIGYVWPEPSSSAAGTRMMQLIGSFLSRGFDISFATTAVRTQHMADLESLGVATEKIELNHSSFDEFLAELQPRVVLFDRFMMEEQFGWRVARICPGALRLLDTEDLHFLRKARQEAVKKEVSPGLDLLQNDLAKREVASIYRCDLSLIISRSEMKLLLEQFRVPQSLLMYLPLWKEDLPGDTPSPSFEARRHFVSIGNFRHEPNWDAVLQLKQHIWPLVRKELPDAEMHIYGAYPTRKAHDLHDGSSGFLVKGRAASAARVIREARVLLSPLRFGAGIKGKFLDAMQQGTPAVTSGIGAEAMHDGFPWNGYIEEQPVAFAQAAVLLYRDKERWLEARENGFRILKELFSREVFETGFQDHLVALVQDLDQHRHQNFTGSMLLHHRLQSTRYLSRYIEVKNQLEALREQKNDLHQK